MNKQLAYDLSKRLQVAYNSTLGVIGRDEFEKLMPEVAADIIDLQYKGTKPISFLTAGLCLSAPEEDDTPEELACKEIINAAIWWQFLNEGEDMDLNKLLKI